MDLVEAVLGIGIKDDISSSDMCNAFITEAPDSVLDVLDRTFKRTKMRNLMDALVESWRFTPKAPECFCRAYARYGIPPSRGCWKFVHACPLELNKTWHAVLKDKVNPIPLSAFELQRIVTSFTRDDEWRERLLDLEKRAFDISLDDMKTVRSNLRGTVQSFHKFVTAKIRSAGSIKAGITKQTKTRAMIHGRESTANAVRSCRVSWAIGHGIPRHDFTRFLVPTTASR